MTKGSSKLSKDKKQDKQIAKITKMLSATKCSYSANPTSGNATSSWGFFPLTTSIAIGDNADNRTGNQIDVMSVKGFIDMVIQPTAGLNNWPRMRACLFTSKNEGALPLYTDIFDVNNIDAVYSQNKNLNNFSSVYSDKLIVSTTAQPTNVQQLVTIRRLHFKKIFKKGHKCSWTTTGNNAASTGTGQIFMGIVFEDNYNAVGYPLAYTINHNVIYTS